MGDGCKESTFNKEAIFNWAKFIKDKEEFVRLAEDAIERDLRPVFDCRKTDTPLDAFYLMLVPDSPVTMDSFKVRAEGGYSFNIHPDGVRVFKIHDAESEIPNELLGGSLGLTEMVLYEPRTHWIVSTKLHNFTVHLMNALVKIHTDLLNAAACYWYPIEPVRGEDWMHTKARLIDEACKSVCADLSLNHKFFVVGSGPVFNKLAQLDGSQLLKHQVRFVRGPVKNRDLTAQSEDILVCRHGVGKIVLCHSPKISYELSADSNDIRFETMCAFMRFGSVLHRPDYVVRIKPSVIFV